jgi:uncharacterized glyoxalase superfamily protein PhnB
MMKIEEADATIIVGLVVKDAEKMIEFYQDVLGMNKLFTDTGDEGRTKHYLGFKGGMLKLFAPDDPPASRSDDPRTTTGYVNQTFLITNMTEIFEKMEGMGVKIVTPIQVEDTGTKWGEIEDPEGNLIELAGEG